MAERPGPATKAVPKAAPPKAGRYLITYAQNASKVCAPFLAALETYARVNDARLVVVPGRYRNPTSQWSKAAKDDDWWAPELAPYLCRGKIKIGKLTVHGDISIQPTAKRPLTGFEAYALDASAVFAHPKIELGSIASVKAGYPRLFSTTGAVTLPNYTPSGAGAKGLQAHTLGALVVERATNGLFHMRHVTWNGSSFIDLDRQYGALVASPAPPAAFLVLGDVHVMQADPAVLSAVLWREDSMRAVLRPGVVVLHDVLDFNVRNHHKRGDWRDAYDRRMGHKVDSVRVELDQAVDFLRRVGKGGVVVASNHDEAADRWLAEGGGKTDPINAPLYYAMMAAQYARKDAGQGWCPAFRTYAEPLCPDTRFLARDEPFKGGRYALHHHGDKGPNGARGSIESFAKMGVPVVIGHHHGPAMRDRARQVGACMLNADYTSGPSSWCTSMCVGYADGSDSLIHVINGEYKA